MHSKNIRLRKQSPQQPKYERQANEINYIFFILNLANTNMEQ